MTANDRMNLLLKKGAEPRPGLTGEEFRRIEETYGVVFPQSLREFYETVLPVTGNPHEFPDWRDFSQENTAAVRERMKAPYVWLARDIDRGFRLPQWKGTAQEILRGAPVLIPVFGHRYMPVTGCSDPPVFSTVGQDTVWYGSNLDDWLVHEFGERTASVNGAGLPYVPLWSDIMAYHAEASERRMELLRQMGLLPPQE